MASIVSDATGGADHTQYLQRIEQLRADLLGLLDLYETYTQANHHPALGSQAMADETEDERATKVMTWRPILNGRHYAALQLSAARDHLGAMCRLLELEATVLFADRVLIRAGVEACARAHWLVRPGLSPRERAARGLSERLHDLYWRDQVLDPSGHRERMDTTAAFIGDLGKAGFNVKPPGKVPAYVIGYQRPSATYTMKKLFNDDADSSLGASCQSYLSLFVHATPAGLLSAAMQDDALPTGNHVASVPFGSNSGTVNALLAVATHAWVIATTTYLTHLGWIDDDWRKATRNSAVLGLRTLTLQQRRS